MLRRESSISRASPWCAARISTACRLQFDARLAVLDHLLDHVIDLGHLVLGGDEPRLLLGGSGREELLAEALRRLVDHRIAGVQDRLGRSVVAFEGDDSGGRR